MVKRPVLAEVVAEDIREKIVGGTYRTGDRLPTIQDMAREYGVSTNCMRDSFRDLEMAGLVSVKHGRGCFVTDHLLLNQESVSTQIAINHLKLQTVYEARMVVEVGAVPLALERITDEQVIALRAIVESGDQTSSAQSLSQADIDLHMGLIRAAGNPLLSQMLEPLVTSIMADIRFIHTLPQVLDEFVEWHMTILRSVEARDVTGCQQALRTHLGRGLGILLSTS
jgi:GntR family transcriptional repressor for pyruvate dehydrogenase complex